MRAGALLLAALAVLLAGCGHGGGGLQPVRGKVLRNNAPVAGASVVFHLEDLGDPTATKPSAVTAADGSFTLSTYPAGEGAAAGNYVVLVTQYPPDARDHPNKARNMLPGKFASPETSPLRATVEPGTNDLKPFELGT